MSENTTNKNNDSTLGAMLQGVAGAVQSGIGQLAGSGKDIQEGETRKAEAEKRDELSHTVAK